MDSRFFSRFASAVALLLVAPAAFSQMVVFSEIMAQPLPGKPQYLLLENLSATPFDIAEWELTQGVSLQFPGFSTNSPKASFLKAFERLILSSASEAATRSAYRFPENVRIFGPWSGKLKSQGERITLQDKNGVIVCTLKYSTRSPWPLEPDSAGRPLVLLNPNAPLEDGKNWILSPQGTSLITLARSNTLSAVNPPSSIPSGPIIINEIMFAPSSTNGQYIELFNRGANAVDLSGWQFDQGIHFRFPPGTILGAGGFLVIASHTNFLRQAYGDLPMLGEFTGKLRHHGELLGLLDSAGQMVNELAYANGGNWPDFPQTAGCSLELIHPSMDNQKSSAWRASDESAKEAFRVYSSSHIYRELYPAGQPSDYKKLQLYLVGRGHVVLRGLALLNAGVNCLSNAARLSTNGAGDTGWLCQGTHWASFFANGEFHLISDGRGDARADRAELSVPALQGNQTYELRFEGRWVSGKPRLIAQTWDGSFSHSFLLPQPQNGGTPGRPNSRRLPEPPPQLDALQHTPAVPHPTNRVQISVNAFSASPLKSVQLFHRPDSAAGNGVWRRKNMSAQEGAARWGQRAMPEMYSAELTEYTNRGQVVQFYAQAVAQNGLTASFPAGGAEEPAMLVIDDQVCPRDLGVRRLIVSAHDRQAFAQGNSPQYQFHFPRMSHHYFPATFIVNEQDIYYGAAARNSGSALLRSGELRKPKVKLPGDAPFRGQSSLVYDDDAAEGQAYHNRMTRYLLYLLGHPANQNEFVRLLINAGPAQLREETEPVDHDFLNRNFPQGSQGELYRICDDPRFLNNGQAIQQDAEWSFSEPAALSGARQNWRKRTRETEDDYSRLFELFALMSKTNLSPAEVETCLDVPSILKLAAVRGYIGDWDNFTLQRGRNGFLYRHADHGRFQLLHWDSDEAFVPGQPLYGPRLKGLLAIPAYERLFNSNVLALAEYCSQNPARVKAWLEVEKEAAGGSVFQATYLKFFEKRSREVLGMKKEE